jgi:hypothetical protein
MACDEMDLYYRYLDAIEEAKRRAQPWQCEVTVFPQPEEAATMAVPAPAKGSSARGSSPFKCDEPE